jgi:hypothetical protein
MNPKYSRIRCENSPISLARLVREFPYFAFAIVAKTRAALERSKTDHLREGVVQSLLKTHQFTIDFCTKRVSF